MQELGVNWLLPGGDVVSRTVAPAAVPATAVDEAFRQMFGAGNSTPGKEASLAGVVAAGLAGMIAPEFRRGDAGRQKGHPAAGKWNRRRKQ
jgi:hypothetical protein